MPELIRSIAARLRSLIGNRRRSPRLKARLPLTVSIAVRQKAATGAKLVPALRGHTRDLSATGLALILPSILIGEQHLTGEGRTLLISLELPAGPIQIQAVPARYERLDEETAEKLYLVGARITQMSEDDRALFNEYLQGLK
jgi:c-di-GMP-binding flagellar brake protein YcgR